MRHDTTLADDVIDLFYAVQRANEAERIGLLTVRAHGQGAWAWAVDARLTEDNAGNRIATFHDVDTDNNRTPAAVLVNASANDQAAFITTRLATLATPKE